MLIGYARIFTHEQTLDLQKDALEKEGCEQIFTDTESQAQNQSAKALQRLSSSLEGEIP